MTNRPRILLLIPHLGGGGAERVIAHLARNLSPEKFELHLGLVRQLYAETGLLSKSVTIHMLGASRVRTSALRLIRLVWRLRPSVILSGMAHLNLLVLMLRPLFPPHTSVLVRQNSTTSPEFFSSVRQPRSPLRYRIFYRFANRVICQSIAMAESLHTQIGIPRGNLVVLANPIDIDSIRALVGSVPSQWSGPGPHLLAVGRLSPEKGFDLLLEALAIVRLQYSAADLTIAGAGPCEYALKTQCAALGLGTSVRFLGRIPSPEIHFCGATLFVLPSRHEGMPNALLEAAAAGLPIVATPASQGLVDLLKGQPGVWVARDHSAKALSESLLAAFIALAPAQRFPHPWIEHFRMNHAIAAYEALIAATIRGQRK